MGVHGLWKILEPAAQKASFCSLAACQGFERKYHDFPMLRIGVDASLLTSAAIAATRAGTIHSQAHNTALKNFFYRLCRLLNVPATFIFVFDGASRPAVKRGRNVVSDAPWVEAYARSMIEDFGCCACTS